MVDNMEDNSKDLVMYENQSDQNHENQSDQNHENQNPIETENNDEFIRITGAHQIITEGNLKRKFCFSKNFFYLAQKYEEQNNYPIALHFYRICADLLLEELMFTEGTEQSRIYLREKCTAIMDRIDLLKTKLEPIPLSIPTEQSITNPPIDQLESINSS
jgi:hypothetical protein